MKITKEKAAMLCMALKAKINELYNLPEPISTREAAPFTELYHEIYNEFLAETTEPSSKNSSSSPQT